MVEIDIPINFGDWLKRRRRSLDLTQSELAQRAGCSIFALRKIEAGERRPSKQLAGLLAQALEISTEDSPTFIKVARGERDLEHLPGQSQMPFASTPLGHLPKPSPLNLPLSLTPFIGRAAELKSISRLLRDPHCRLLTLVGHGGIGKTRLAVEAAFRNQEIFPDRVCFIPLVALDSPVFLSTVIADALGFNFQGEGDPQIQLINYLRNKSALLVLDGAEHLLEGAGLFSEILESAPRVNLLVTSRERLNLRGEWVFLVQGLRVPPFDQVDSLEEYSSVALFIQSARRVRADFELQSRDREQVVHICRLLEGMPLAIELAAGWVSLLTCQEIREEIERSLDFLTTSFRDIPERHRSLRAVFDYSWNLLSPAERRVLCRLSVFRSGFNREAALRVAEASLSLLSALVDKSLLRQAEGERYDLHNAVQQYARTHLALSPTEEMSARELHSAYYLELIRQLKDQLSCEDQKQAVAIINADIDNIRLAWDWAVERRQSQAILHSLDTLWRFYALQNWFQEGIPVFEKVVEEFSQGTTSSSGETEAEHSVIVGQALAKAGWFHFRLGRLELAIQMLRQSIDLLSPLNDQQALAFSLTSLGGILSIAMDDPGGTDMLVESIKISRAIGDPWLSAVSLANMAISAMTWRDKQEGYNLAGEAVSEARVAGDPAITSFCLSYRGLAAFMCGKLGEAHDLLSESLAMSRAYNNRWDMATALRHLGQIAHAEGQFLEAEQRFQESVAIFAELGMRFSQARTLNQCGEAALAMEDHPGARKCLQAGLRLALEDQAIPVALASLFGLACLFAKEGAVIKAVELLASIRDHPASEKETRERSSNLLAELRAQLTDEQAAAIQEQNMSFETAAAIALAS